MKTLPVVLWILFLGAGCGPKMIPDLPIEVSDTTDHRAILKVLENFMKSYEALDIEGLLALTSERFYETSGSNETSKHFNREGLRKHFGNHFKTVKKCILELELKDLTQQGDDATLDYRYLTRFLMDLPSGEKWQVTDDVAQMKLVKENGTWKVLSGM